MPTHTEDKMEDFKRYQEEGARTDYIKVDELKEGYLYYIHARNANYGIWFPSEEGFVIRRAKFGDIFTFTELHWDVSEWHGTAKPFKELEKGPFTDDDLVYKSDETRMWRPRENDMLDWLRDRTQHWEDLHETD
jgi:hypothetical protein